METALAPFVLFGRDYGNLDPVEFAARPAWRVVYSLWRQIDGVCHIERSGQRWTIQPDEVALAEPGCRVTTAAGSRMRLVCFALTPHGLESSATKGGYVMDPGCPVQPGWQDLFDLPFTPRLDHNPKAAAAVVDYLLSRYWRGDMARLEANARLYQWILQELHLRGQGTDLYPWGNIAAHVDRLIDVELRHVSVASLAERLHVTRQHLQATYKTETKCQLAVEIRRRRMEHAKELLCLHPNASISQVANEVGYRSPSAFTHAFREFAGMTPRQWRRSRH